MSGMVRTKVDDNGMSSAAKQIENDLNSLRVSFKRISEALNETLSPTWEGTSKSTFFDRYETDAAEYAAHTDAISLLNELLREATRIYASADDGVQEIVNNIKIT